MAQEHAKPLTSRIPKSCRPLFYCPPQSRLAALAAGKPTLRAVFLDRDGTIVEDIGYLTAASQLKLLPGAVDGIRLLQEEFMVVIITNQSTVARGLLDEEELVQIHQALARTLQSHGVFLDAVYACPHHPRSGYPPYRRQCDCRKPQPGMLLQAMDDFGIQPSLSFMIGDTGSDILAGQRAGVAATVLVKSPKTGASAISGVVPTYVADNLREAAQLTLGHP